MGSSDRLAHHLLPSLTRISDLERRPEIHRDRLRRTDHSRLITVTPTELTDTRRPTGIIEARTKEVKLRLLDVNRAKAESSFWQILNIVVPLLILGIFGFLYNFVRRRRFGSAT